MEAKESSTLGSFPSSSPPESDLHSVSMLVSNEEKANVK
jgi:hypothetical protein